MNEPTLTKAPTPAAGTPATLAKAPARIYAPDLGDRLRALQKTATIAAMGSAPHWRRLARLDPSVKRALWDSLTPEQRESLKAIRASLDYPPPL
jgi:hypothetical protein